MPVHESLRFAFREMRATGRFGVLRFGEMPNDKAFLLTEPEMIELRDHLIAALG